MSLSRSLSQSAQKSVKILQKKLSQRGSTVLKTNTNQDYES